MLLIGCKSSSQQDKKGVNLQRISIQHFLNEVLRSPIATEEVKAFFCYSRLREMVADKFRNGTTEVLKESTRLGNDHKKNGASKNQTYKSELSVTE